MPENHEKKDRDTSEKTGESDAQKQETKKTDKNLLKQKILQEEAARSIAEESQEVRGKATKALDIVVTDTTDSEYEMDIDQKAAFLAQRHNDLCISEELVQLIIDCKMTEEGPEKEELIATLETHRMHANKNGFFLMRYDPIFVKSRLTAAPYSMGANATASISPSYIVAEAGGTDPKQEDAQNAQKLWAADCNVHLPAPSREAKIVINALQEGDTLTMEHYANELSQKPWSMAIVDDLACEEGMQHHGFAGAAMAKAIETIVQKVNPERGEFPIEYIAAEIASIKGIVLPDDTKIMLPDLNVNPIGNGRSRYVFEHCRFGFEHAWELVDREHEVLLPGDDPKHPHKIIVKWWVMIADLKRINTKES